MTPVTHPRNRTYPRNRVTRYPSRTRSWRSHVRALVGALVVIAFVAPISCGGDSFEGIVVPVTLATAGLALDGVESVEFVVTGVALVPCQAQTRVRLGLGPASAAAHTESTPTALGEPRILDLVGATEVAAGELEPPAGCWGEVRISIGPADADAVDGVDTAIPTGASVAIVRDDGDRDYSTIRHTLVAPLGDHGLDVRAGFASSLRIEIASALGVTDLDGLAGPDAARAVLESLRATAWTP